MRQENQIGFAPSTATTTTKATIFDKLAAIQQEIRVNKDSYNSYSDFRYRSAEQILGELKPLLEKHHTTLLLTDQMVNIGERYYLEATATLINLDGEDTIATTAYAREDADRAGISQSQCTGCASSYARKYALNGLLLLDDESQDPDHEKYSQKPKKQASEPKKAEPDAQLPKGLYWKIKNAESIDTLKEIYEKETYYHNNNNFKQLMSDRKKQLQQH